MTRQGSERGPFDVFIIGGLGHVGLPFGLVLADAGFRVGLHDINAAHADAVRKGEMPFMEEGGEELLERVLDRTLHIAPELASMRGAEHIVITIGTPIDEYMNPDIGPLFRLAESMRPFLGSDSLIMLRSTVMPGVSQTFYEELRGGTEIDFTFCPERVAQGFAIREIRELPQIVSGFSPRAVSRARALFERVGPEVIELPVAEAELAKLFCNAWRYVQFAVSNQFYTLATERGLDFARILEGMTRNYRRMGSFPRPGFAAGPCLMKDTMQLSAYARQSFALGQAAMFVNEGLPAFLVDQLEARVGGELRGRRVGILGMAFKPDVDDIRDSLSFKLRKLLRLRGAEVMCSDEHASQPDFVTREVLIEACESIIVAVPHQAYAEIELGAEKTLIDLWNVVRRT